MTAGVVYQTLAPPPAGALLDIRKLGFRSRDIGIEIFEAKQQLLVEPSSGPAKLAALQLLRNEPQPFDLSLCLGEGSAVSHERSHPLQPPGPLRLR
jgi:hypothetical protein